MPTASITKKILCSKKNLIEIVLDIEKYPDFIPWCISSKIYTKIEKKSNIEIVADLTIGKNFFKDTYKSFVIYNKSSDSIKVTNIEGPLKYLKNTWNFQELEDYCEVKFYVDFELKNKILNILMIKTFELALKKIATSFEKRANDLFN